MSPAENHRTVRPRGFLLEIVRRVLERRHRAGLQDSIRAARRSLELSEEAIDAEPPGGRLVRDYSILDPIRSRPSWHR